MDCLSASQLRPSGELAASPARASRFLTADDTGRLIRFYLGFDFEARRSRFGEAVSDDAIHRILRRHRVAAFDPDRARRRR